MANEIFIYDDIGPAWMDMVDAKHVIDQLNKFSGKPVVVRLNSNGGDVNHGIAIYNALKRHRGGVTVAVDAIAASAASLVAMAGDKIEMASNARMMVHNAWTFTAGNKEDHMRTIEILDAYDETLVETYAARTGLSADDVRSLLTAETWMRAQPAVDKGFADAVTGDSGVIAAGLKEGRYRNTPQELIRNELPRGQDRKRREQDASLRLRLTRARFGR